jgi:hypothetical protein
MVEPRIVVPDVAGSNPVGHPRAVWPSAGTMTTYFTWIRRHPAVPEFVAEKLDNDSLLGLRSGGSWIGGPELT